MNDHAGPCSYGCCPDGWCWCDGNRPDLAKRKDDAKAAAPEAEALPAPKEFNPKNVPISGHW